MAGVNFWDVTAGIVLVIKAGGITLDVRNDEFVPKSGYLVAGSREFVKLMTHLVGENY